MSKKAVAIILLSVWFFSSSLTTLYALEDQFEIHLTVTPPADVTAPSVPTSLTATAVSSSQIDLVWTASTDNVAVTGYRVYRDNAFVTTVGSVNYSDIGLSANTTYDYTVSAIDATPNESARSATSTATTFPAPAATPGGGGTSQVNSPVIYNLTVTPSAGSATITWQTTQPTIGTLSWGQTQNYEIGTDAQAIYSTQHSVTIPALTPGTQYYFTITAQNGYGKSTTLPNQQFITLPLVQGLANPTNFTATPRTNDIGLTWKNPTDQGFKEVRVVRGKDFYPSDPNDGEVLYEGSGTSVPDANVIVGKTYFYAIFAKYDNGEYSSGVVARARIPLPGEPVTPPTDIYETIPKAPSVDPVIESLTFLDFDFVQDGKRISTLTNGETVEINGNKNLTVSLDYTKVPEILKSMVVTLTDPDDSTKTFSFLLRVNSEKTFYSATIGPLGKSGKYKVNISIVDYKNRGLKKIVGDLVANVSTGFVKEERVILVLRQLFFNLLLLIIILVIVYRAFKAVFEKNKHKSFAGIDSNEGLY